MTRFAPTTQDRTVHLVRCRPHGGRTQRSQLESRNGIPHLGAIAQKADCEAAPPDWFVCGSEAQQLIADALEEIRACLAIPDGAISLSATLKKKPAGHHGPGSGP